jgi:Methyltransferase FkbM domain
MMRSIKTFFLRLLPKPLIHLFSTLKLLLKGDYLRLQRQVTNLSLNLEMVNRRTLLPYHQLVGDYVYHDKLNQHEAKIYSQNGEDGILLYLFSQIGITNGRFVEFGIGNGRECNTANLSLNFGWHGLLMEIDPQQVAAARRYYQQQLGSEQDRVQIVEAGLTAVNINTLLTQNNLQGEIDLLSIDMDGNDYWVWQAIDVIQPRLVVIEYNASFGKQRSISVPYDPNFNIHAKHPSGFYHGASLTALTKLGRQKGYRLVGCDSSGSNAFFVHQTATQKLIKELLPQEAYFPHIHRTKFLTTEQQFQIIAHLPFDEM